MGIEGYVHSVESMGTLDGPGLRYVLFLQGCPLRCRYCHNPDTWKAKGRALSDSQEVVDTILSYKSFIRDGGVTISGGEPLMQSEFSLDIIRRCRQEGLHTALDTAGSVPLETSREVLDEVNLVLLDIKSLDDAQCRALTGVGNTNTLKTLEYCESINRKIWLRHVLVPGWTLDSQRLEVLADYLGQFSCIEQVELLPYHSMGRSKWAKLNLVYTLSEVKEPGLTELIEAKEIFLRKGIPVMMDTSHLVPQAV
ncbi:MAG: pyruvate formate lyase-activating protein [Sphaerochaetaceae bacterium]|nr:pyruvate formate lyase-activating protein [Sphaerochaetaceae bacterium]